MQITFFVKFFEIIVSLKYNGMEVWYYGAIWFFFYI